MKSNVPSRINVRREAREMEIEWKDGGTRRIALSHLRKFCPCALCVGLREKQAEKNELTMLTDAEMAATDEILAVDPVGRYALQIRWTDGHDTGIYTYEYLRHLVDELGEGGESG